MNITQRTKDLTPRPLLRLSEIERILKANRIIVPTLSRRTLIEMCEEGTFETAPRVLPNRNLQWLVYEDSFLAWVAKLNNKG